MSDDNQGWIVLALVGIAIFSLNRFLCNEQVIVYQSYCADLVHNPMSCNDKVRVRKLTFSVFPSEQIVVSKELVNLSPCRVFDNKNWQCEAQGNSQSMVDGKYRERANYDAGSIHSDGKPSLLPLYRQIDWSIEYYIRWTISLWKELTEN